MEPKCGQSSGEGDVFMTTGKKFMKDNTELKYNPSKYKSKKQKAKGKEVYQRQRQS